MPNHGAELYSAAYHGNAASIRKLISRGADLKWRHPQGGATALYVACEFGHAEAAQLLLESGAPADAARDDGATPLYKACQDGGPKKKRKEKAAPKKNKKTKKKNVYPASSISLDVA